MAIFTFYVAAKRQEEGRRVRNTLLGLGYKVNARWLDATGFGKFQTAWERQLAANECETDVRACDALVLVAEPESSWWRRLLCWTAGVPARGAKGGKHVELGIALALNKPLYVIGQRENVFHYSPKVRVYASVDTFVMGIEYSQGYIDFGRAGFEEKS